MEEPELLRAAKEGSQAALQRLVLGQRPRKLGHAMRALSERERVVVTRRHLDHEPGSLSAVGRELGVSRERVRQIELAARRKLRKRWRAAVGATLSSRAPGNISAA